MKKALEHVPVEQGGAHGHPRLAGDSRVAVKATTSMPQFSRTRQWTSVDPGHKWWWAATSIRGGKRGLPVPLVGSGAANKTPGGPKGDLGDGWHDKCEGHIAAQPMNQGPAPTGRARRVAHVAPHASGGGSMLSMTVQCQPARVFFLFVVIGSAASQASPASGLSGGLPSFGWDRVGSTEYPIFPLSELYLEEADLDGGEDWPECSILVNGRLYIATGTNPGRIVQIDPRTLRRIRTIRLAPGEDRPRSVVAFGGSLYFGTNTRIGRIVEVGLSPFERRRSLKLAPGDNYLLSAVAAGRNAYFATGGEARRIVQVDLAAMRRLGSLELDDGTEPLETAVAWKGMGYFGAKGRILRIGLSPLRELGSLSNLPSGSARILSSVRVNGEAFFGTDGRPSSILRLDLAGFRVTGSLRLQCPDEWEFPFQCEEGLGAAVATDSHLYFAIGTGNVYGRILRVERKSLTRAGVLYTEKGIKSAALWNGAGFFVADSSPGKVAKIDLDAFKKDGLLLLRRGEENPQALAIVGDHAYLATGTRPARLVRINLRTFRHDRAIDLAPEEIYPSLLLTAGSTAYLATGGTTGRIVEIDLREFRRTGAWKLPSDWGYITCGFVSKGRIYLGTTSEPARILRFDLSPLRLTGSLRLESGQTTLRSAVAVGNYGYFAMDGQRWNDPTRVVQIDLDQMRQVETISFAPGKWGRAVTALAYRNAPYILAGASLIKLRLHPLAIEKSLNLDSCEWGISIDARSAVVSGKTAYIGTVGSFSQFDGECAGILAIDLDSFQQIDCPVGAADMQSALLAGAADKNFVYFTVSGYPDRLLRLRPRSQEFRIQATRAHLEEPGEIVAMQWYAHEAAGHVRLALYDSSRDLLWQSHPRKVDRGGVLLTIPISSGSPSRLDPLTPGDYFLAWQIDTPAPVPSYTEGHPGDGWTESTWEFDAFPSWASSVTPTAAKWTQFAIYKPVETLETPRFFPALGLFLGLLLFWRRVRPRGNPAQSKGSP